MNNGSSLETLNMFNTCFGITTYSFNTYGTTTTTKKKTTEPAGVFMYLANLQFQATGALVCNMSQFTHSVHTEHVYNWLLQ